MGDVTIEFKDDTIKHFINARYSIYSSEVIVRQYDNDILFHIYEFAKKDIKTFNFTINYD